MYIEFNLPNGASGYAAQHVNKVLEKELQIWSERYSIGYRKKIVKWTARVTLDDENAYSLFALTWNPSSTSIGNWLKFSLIEPMKY